MGERTDRQRATPQTRDLAQVRPGCPHLSDDLPSMPRQHLTRLGGNHSAGSAVEEGLAHFLLQLPQLLRDG